MANVPIIDLGPSLHGIAGERHAVAREIGKACENIGFLMITGHGVPQSLVDEAEGLSREFFALPLEEKMRLAIDDRRSRGRGYRPMGRTQLAKSRGEAAPSDLREQFVSGPDAPAGDPYYERPDVARFFPPNAWPERLPGLSTAFGAYYKACSGVARNLMQLFALALGLPEQFFDDKIDRHITQLVSACYPRQTTAPEPGQLRAGAHTDFGSLTLLATDGSPGGLQVMMPDGEWQDIVPVNGAFIVNIGDLMAQWTNDRWRSTLHRVVNPPHAVAGSSSRHSLVFFHQPNCDAWIECLPSCIAPGEAPKYAPITSGAHLLGQLAKIHQPPKAAEQALV